MGNEYLPFELARAIVRSEGLGSQVEWKAWSSTQRPRDIPGAPDMYYPEYISLPDWLGYAADDRGVASVNEESQKQTRDAEARRQEESRARKRGPKETAQDLGTYANQATEYTEEATPSGRKNPTRRTATRPPPTANPYSRTAYTTFRPANPPPRTANIHPLGPQTSSQGARIIPPSHDSRPDPSAPPTKTRKTATSSAPTSSRPCRPTPGPVESHVPLLTDGSLVPLTIIQTNQQNTKTVVDLVLKYSKNDPEKAGKLLVKVLTHLKMKEAKAASGIILKEDCEMNKDIVNNIREALPKLVAHGNNNADKERQSVYDGVLEAAVSANPTHPVTSIATALGVDRRHIAAACKRREERDKQPRWIVTMCSRKHGEGRRVPEDALKACVTFWQDLMQQDFMQNLPINNGLALQDHTLQDHAHEGHTHQAMALTLEDNTHEDPSKNNTTGQCEDDETPLQDQSCVEWWEMFKEEYPQYGSVISLRKFRDMRPS